jgi:hypothetical protein
MKKILLLAFAFVSFASSAQKTIVEEKFEKNNLPLNCVLIGKTNKLVIKKGKYVGISTNKEVNSLISYDENGNNQTLLKDGRFMNIGFSTLDNSFIASEYASMKWTSDFKIYNENTVSTLINKDVGFTLFNKDYGLSIVNQEENYNLDFDKDDIFLQKFFFKNKKVEKIKLDKPSLNITNKDLYFKLKKIDYRVFFIKDHFEFITKIIKKDCKSATLYRTLYDFNGKIIKNIKHEMSINNPFVLSNNGGGKVSSGYGGSGYFFADQLSINNFIIDEDTNDMYLYGFFGKKDKESLTSDIVGYYVIKYDSTGNVVWQKENIINDKKINNFDDPVYLDVSAAIINDKLTFYAYCDINKNFIFYKNLNLSDGVETGGNSISYSDEKTYSMYSNATKDFLIAQYKINNTKIRFDNLSLVYYDTNPKVKLYIDSIASSKNKIYLNTYQSEKGIWLIESDNETYYKVTYFTHD